MADPTSTTDVSHNEQETPTKNPASAPIVKDESEVGTQENGEVGEFQQVSHSCIETLLKLTSHSPDVEHRAVTHWCPA